LVAVTWTRFHEVRRRIELDRHQVAAGADIGQPLLDEPGGFD
jgi:hypothetical protein